MWTWLPIWHCWVPSYGLPGLCLVGACIAHGFGEGPQNAALMLVGEQPGDQEDLQGRPFVGPAGQVLDKALQDAGLQRHQVYVTNAVKHFHFVWKGSRRLHQKPQAEHVAACRVWLDAERRLVRPALLVMLGVTAAQSVLKSRLQFLPPARACSIWKGRHKGW